MDFLRARRERRYALTISDPQPVTNAESAWSTMSQMATVGIFGVLALVGIYLAKPVLMPVLAAFIVGMTLAPLVKWLCERGLPPWLSAALLVVVLLLMSAATVTLLSTPIIEWIGRGPEIAALIKQKLYVLDWPLEAVRNLRETLVPTAANTVQVESSQMTMIAPVMAVVTPAVTQIMIFAVTLLLFMVTQANLRSQLALLFTSRDAKLRFLRIANDIQQNLASYLAVVTVLNVLLGIAVAFGAWAFGLPSPIMLGVMTTILNFLPYIGPTIMVLVIFGVSLVTYPTLLLALLPPAAFVALTTVEGQIITPTVIGHRLTLNPLVVFIAIIFWAWLWGPMGAFLALPLSIVALVIFNHIAPADDGKIPD